MALVYRRLLALPVIAIATSVLAQDKVDWDIVRNADDNVVLAYIAFDAGVGVAVRCIDGGYEAVITGLPATEAVTRTVEVGFEPDGPLQPQIWDVGANRTVALSSLPAPFARQLRQGGTLQLRIPASGTEGRALRYVLDLPPSSVAIDETLTACERPLVDPRDEVWKEIGQNGLPSNLEWAQAPRIQYPGIPRYERGFAVVSCVSDPLGKPQDCVIETEHPRDAGFGEAALRGARGGRLTNVLNPDAPIPPSRFNFRAQFVVSGLGEQPRRQTGTRITPRD